MKGMRWENIVNILQGMIYKNGFPSTVLIFCGGNDIGDIPCVLFLHQMRLTFATLIELIPGCSDYMIMYFAKNFMAFFTMYCENGTYQEKNKLWNKLVLYEAQLLC
jgi:hypothetical protein